MSSVSELQERLRQAERNLDDARREMESARKRQDREYSERLRQLEAKMHSDIAKHDKATHDEYERLLRDYQRSVSMEVTDHATKMDLDYQRMLRNQRKAQDTLTDLMRQLEDEINRLKNEIEEKDARKSNEAIKQMHEAEKAREEAICVPFEKFYPARMRSLKDQFDAAVNYHDLGLDEAAAGLFVVASVGFRKLKHDVDEERADWERQFEIFKCKANSIRMRLERMIFEWHSLANDENFDEAADLTSDDRKEAVLCLDFWTKGIYRDVSDRVSVFISQVKDAEKHDTADYLKNPGSISMDDMRNGISIMSDLAEKLDKAIFKERFEASCERYDLSEKIISYFHKELNFECGEKGENHYRHVLDDYREKSDYVDYMSYKFGDGYYEEDFREWYELVMEDSIGSRFFIYIVPYETENGVENHVNLHIDSPSRVDEDYMDQIRMHVVDAIGKKYECLALEFVGDATALKFDSNAMTRSVGRAMEMKVERMRRVSV